MSNLTIDIPEELLSRVNEYQTIYKKTSLSETVKELLNYAFTLPPYFHNWDWEKAEFEADEAITRGEVIGPFDNIKDALRSLKEIKRKCSAVRYQQSEKTINQDNGIFPIIIPFCFLCRDVL